MTEAAVSSKLRVALCAQGALCWKISDRFHSARPDLLLVSHGITSYIETKIYPNKPTQLQLLTLQQLSLQGAPAWVLTYNKQRKDYTLCAVATGTQTNFTDHRKMAVWLLEHNSLITSNKQST